MYMYDMYMGHWQDKTALNVYFCIFIYKYIITFDDTTSSWQPQALNAASHENSREYVFIKSLMYDKPELRCDHFLTFM